MRNYQEYDETHAGIDGSTIRIKILPGQEEATIFVTDAEGMSAITINVPLARKLMHSLNWAVVTMVDNYDDSVQEEITFRKKGKQEGGE